MGLRWGSCRKTSLEAEGSSLCFLSVAERSGLEENKHVKGINEDPALGGSRTPCVCVYACPSALYMNMCCVHTCVYAYVPIYP